MTNKIIPDLQAASNNWDAMTRNEKAVALATDVIALLSAKHIAAESGIYLSAAVPRQFLLDDDLRQTLLASRKCHVCAVGAVFVAKVMARDGLKVRAACNLSSTGHLNALNAFLREPLTDEINDAFTAGTLRLIECAFEGGWKNEYSDDDERLRAIMQRVIENGGEFTSSDEGQYGEYEEEDEEDEDDFDDED